MSGALRYACPKCGALPWQRCRSIERRRPGRLMIVHSDRIGPLPLYPPRWRP